MACLSLQAFWCLGSSFDEKDLGSSSWWQVSGELMNKGELACVSLKGNFVCLMCPCMKKVEGKKIG